MGCSTSSFSATVLANMGAGGTASLSLSAWAFGSCSTSISGLSAPTLSLTNLPYHVTINGSTKVITITGSGPSTPITFAVGFTSSSGHINCGLQARSNTVTGLASNTDNSWTSTNQELDLATGGVSCPRTLFLSATYAPVVYNGQPVFVS